MQVEKMWFQLYSKADHLQMCVFICARMTFTLTPWPWYSTLT